MLRGFGMPNSFEFSLISSFSCFSAKASRPYRLVRGNLEQLWLLNVYPPSKPLTILVLSVLLVVSAWSLVSLKDRQWIPSYGVLDDELKTVCTPTSILLLNAHKLTGEICPIEEVSAVSLLTTSSGELASI